MVIVTSVSPLRFAFSTHLDGFPLITHGFTEVTMVGISHCTVHSFSLVYLPLVQFNRLPMLGDVRYIGVAASAT
jgi:hypothetical protein